MHPDPRTMHRINQLIFDGSGDELFEALAELVDELSLQVGENALERLSSAVRKARGLRGAW
jgi:hypothetical protein